MICADREALLCDLAETYGIFDLRALPVSTLATLAVGLREDSRIKRKLLGNQPTMTEMLLAAVFDKLSILAWLWSKDGQTGDNRPESLLSAILGEKTENSGAAQTFETGEEFEAEWRSITGVGHG